MAKRRNTFGAYEARTHFSELVERVERGEVITITRHGNPVVRMVPVRSSKTPDQRKAAIEALRQFASGRSLGGLRIKDLINEGHR